MEGGGSEERAQEEGEGAEREAQGKSVEEGKGQDEESWWERRVRVARGEVEEWKDWARGGGD